MMCLISAVGGPSRLARLGFRRRVDRSSENDASSSATRKSLLLTSKSETLTRKSLLLTSKSEMLARKSLLLTRVPALSQPEATHAKCFFAWFGDSVRRPRPERIRPRLCGVSSIQVVIQSGHTGKSGAGPRPDDKPVVVLATIE